MFVTIKTPGSHVTKLSDEPDTEASEAERLGCILGAALYAVGPVRLDEVVGRTIEFLAEHGAFSDSPALPAREALSELCHAARRIVDEWKQHDERTSSR